MSWTRTSIGSVALHHGCLACGVSVMQGFTNIDGPALTQATTVATATKVNFNIVVCKKLRDSCLWSRWDRFLVQ
eukprot:m.180514 g.180514  ORF g.180514 m.180514 type:complete len:74 (-) comp32023_c1_seq1:49-270(-)